MFSSSLLWLIFSFFFFKQKTAYELRISDWSSDVCSSDLFDRLLGVAEGQGAAVDLRDVKWALGELIPEQRAAILPAAEGLSIEEAAASLAIPAGTFKSRLWRGRLRDRQSVEVGNSVSVRVDLGGRRLIKKKKITTI